MTTPPKVRVCLTLDADAAQLLLDLAGGHERKRGEVVSELIRQRAAFPPLPPIAALRELSEEYYPALLRWVASLQTKAG